MTKTFGSKRISFRLLKKCYYNVLLIKARLLIKTRSFFKRPEFLALFFRLTLNCLIFLTFLRKVLKDKPH